jgi:serine/threonine-protein kinase
VGTTIDDKYEIVREIGRGGFGAVCEAIDRSIGAKVAIKFLNPQVARSKESLEAFKAEAKRVTDLEHPNIVGWKTFGETDDGTRYFVMELLQGDEVEKAIQKEKEGRLKPKRVARIMLQTLDALRKAHRKSILHLDLKPKNVFLVPGEEKRERQDFVKIIDFGIGLHIGGGEVAATASRSDEGPRRGTGTIPAPETAAPKSKKSASSIKRCTGCTPEYASPEQCGHMIQGEEIVALDGRSDIYSLGVMAFQMLTGRLPFEAPSREKRRDWYRIHREVQPRKVRSVQSKVPRRLASFVDRCLSKERDDRFADTDEAYALLDRFVNPPILETAAKMTGVVVLPLIAIGVFVFLFLLPPKQIGRAHV